MTAGAGSRQDREDLFVADFYPRLGEYLAERHATGYDAAAGRARFQAWLRQQAGEQASEQAGAPAGKQTEAHASEQAGAPASARAGDPAEAEAEAETTAADPLRDYLKRVGRVPGLSVAQEAELARRIEAGLAAEAKLAAGGGSLAAGVRVDLEWIVETGTRARNHLLEANLRLVVALAKRYTGRGVPFADLIQAGNLGLIRALERFDYTKGYTFSTYATWWIRQAITRALADPPPGPEG